MRLTDYWEIVRRRRSQFLVPFLVVFGSAVALAFLLPPTYRSEATFLVQRQSVPQNMIETTVNSYVEEQIEQIRQRLVTRSNLLEIARKFNLYPEQIENDKDAVVSDLREKVEVEMVDVRASDPDRKSGSQQITTIGFTVAFSAPTAETAQAATDELAKRFLAEHQARRDAQAAEVSAFLQIEAEQLETEINSLEKELASFKQQELRQLPELMSTNLRLFEKTEQDIEDTEERIRGLQERIEVARAELSLTPAHEAVTNAQGERILTGSERLSVLTAEYFQASSRYSAQHPDIIRLTREIRMLAEQVGNEGRAEELMNRLINLQDQLRDARLQYSDDHPEVQRLERAVSAVQRGFQTEVVRSGADGGPRVAPDNPRYVALQTQIDSSESALQAERQKLQDLRTRLDEYEERLFQTPAVERDFKSITRNYETALEQYAQLRDKQRRANLARNLESGEGGEKFVLSGSAYLPVLPDSPNRIGIGLLGMLFALVGGIGAVALAEHMDHTVRNARMVVASLGVPPLAVIPRIRAR